MRGSQRESGHSQFLQVFQAFSGTVVLSLVQTARDDGFYHQVTIEDTYGGLCEADTLYAAGHAGSKALPNDFHKKCMYTSFERKE
jgi:hypothetical protein